MDMTTTKFRGVTVQYEYLEPDPSCGFYGEVKIYQTSEDIDDRFTEEFEEYIMEDE